MERQMYKFSDVEVMKNYLDEKELEVMKFVKNDRDIG